MAKLLKAAKYYFQEIDIILFATVVAISLISILNLYGVLGAGNPLFIRHIIFVIVGISLMVILSNINYQYLKNYPFPPLALYLLSVFLLSLTFLSRSVRGINAWIIVGNFTFEPSELAKLMLIILLAKYFSQRHVHIKQFRHILISGIYFIIPAILILNQPDLGSALVLISIWLGLLLASGISKKHIFILVIVGIFISYSAWIFILQPYQKDRILSFMNPQSDPLGSGYNVIQSKIAIGSANFFGNGLGRGSQARLGFLPEAHNDFALATATEQFGFIGLASILAVISIILHRALNIGRRARNNFGKLFTVGMSLFIFVHIFINAAVNVGLMPVTGIPFSFISYGGSHLVSIMAGLGIVQSIKKYG